MEMPMLMCFGSREYCLGNFHSFLSQARLVSLANNLLFRFKNKLWSSTWGNHQAVRGSLVRKWKQSKQASLFYFVGFKSTLSTIHTLWPAESASEPHAHMLLGSLSFHGNSLALECHHISTPSDCISRGFWSSPTSNHCPEILIQRSP